MNEQLKMEADAIRAMAANASLCADILRDLVHAIRKGYENDKAEAVERATQALAARTAAAQRLLLVMAREVL